MTDILKIGVLLSGSGSNLQAILDAIAFEDLPVRVVVVVSSRPDAKGLERAQLAGIPTLALDATRYVDPLKADALIVEALQDAQACWVVMAGYMRKLTPLVLSSFPQRVLNIHPALLPAFKGAHAIEDAFLAGVKVTGVTVHLADEDYDRGPIVAQRAIDVCPNDTLESLEKRIHHIEHTLYPQVLRSIAQGRLCRGEGGKVSIL